MQSEFSLKPPHFMEWKHGSGLQLNSRIPGKFTFIKPTMSTKPFPMKYENMICVAIVILVSLSVLYLWYRTHWYHYKLRTWPQPAAIWLTLGTLSQITVQVIRCSGGLTGGLRRPMCQGLCSIRTGSVDMNNTQRPAFLLPSIHSERSKAQTPAWSQWDSSKALLIKYDN